MPNIMMIGFTDEEYDEKKWIIDQEMICIGLGDDAITTYFPTARAESCDGKRIRMPYIIVRSTGGKKEINRIIKALKVRDFRVDCEKQPLPSDGFIEAKDMCT